MTRQTTKILEILKILTLIFISKVLERLQLSKVNASVSYNSTTSEFHVIFQGKGFYNVEFTASFVIENIYKTNVF